MTTNQRPPLGVALAFGFALLRTVMVASAGVVAFSGGDFFPDGQIKRHGWALIVSLNSAIFLPVGPRSFTVLFNFS